MTGRQKSWSHDVLSRESEVGNLFMICDSESREALSSLDGVIQSLPGTLGIIVSRIHRHEIEAYI